MKETIKMMVEEKLVQKGWGISDTNVRDILKKILNRICDQLPQGNSKISAEFVKVMFNSSTGTDKVIDVLIEKVVNERDDLVDYVSIRQEPENAINKWR